MSRVAIYVEDRLPPSLGRTEEEGSLPSPSRNLIQMARRRRPYVRRPSERPLYEHSLTDSLTLHRGRLAAAEEGRPPGGGRINSAKRQSDPLLSLRPTGARRPRSTTWMPLLFPSPLAAWFGQERTQLSLGGTSFHLGYFADDVLVGAFSRRWRRRPTSVGG